MWVWQGPARRKRGGGRAGQRDTREQLAGRGGGTLGEDPRPELVSGAWVGVWGRGAVLVAPGASLVEARHPAEQSLSTGRKARGQESLHRIKNALTETPLGPSTGGGRRAGARRSDDSEPEGGEAGRGTVRVPRRATGCAQARLRPGVPRTGLWSWLCHQSGGDRGTGRNPSVPQRL